MERVKGPTKAERTSLHILKKVAPIFNRKGYMGTSMADITAATGLTKGAIYGNFESKEKLALAAFNFNFKWIIQQLNEKVMEKDSAVDKLKAITDFYRPYYERVIKFGGCPIVNLSVDANYQNPLLFERVKQVMLRMIDRIVSIIELGVEQGLLKSEVDAGKYARLIFSQIEGAVFTAVMTQDPACLNAMLNHVDEMIANQLIRK